MTNAVLALNQIMFRKWASEDALPEVPTIPVAQVPAFKKSTQKRVDKIMAAGNAGTMVAMKYKDRKGNISERIVEPYKLQGEDFWAYDPAKESIRRFKVNNIQSLKSTKSTYIPRWPIEMGEMKIASEQGFKTDLSKLFTEDFKKPGNLIPVWFDFDDTLVTMQPTMIRVLNKLYNQSVAYDDLTEWDSLRKLFNITDDKVFSDVFGAIIDKLRFKENAKETLYIMFQHAGLDVGILSSVKSEEHQMKRLMHIKRELPWFPLHKVVFANDKSQYKGILIDDAFHNVETFGGPTCLINAPHNAKNKEPDNCLRIPAVEDVLPFFFDAPIEMDHKSKVSYILKKNGF